jgi:hypothetical protein
MKHTADFAKRVAALTEDQRAALAASMPIINIEKHALSIRNNCLIALQTSAPVTVVAGFRQWLAAGRCVRKGESALWILAPMTRKAKAEDQTDDDTVTFFREVPVFDIGQTDELPAPAPISTINERQYAERDTL